MIITSPIKLEINKIYNEHNIALPFEFMGIKYKHFALLVIKEATKEEFTNCAKELFNGNIDRLVYFKYFYEISTD